MTMLDCGKHFKWLIKYSKGALLILS